MASVTRQMGISLRGTTSPRVDWAGIKDTSLDDGQGRSSAPSSTRPGDYPWSAGIMSLVLFFLDIKRHYLQKKIDVDALAWCGGRHSPANSLYDAWKKKDGQKWIKRWFQPYPIEELDKIIDVKRTSDKLYWVYIVCAKERPFFSAADIHIYLDGDLKPVKNPHTISNLANKIFTQGKQEGWQKRAEVVPVPPPFSWADDSSDDQVTVVIKVRADSFDKRGFVEKLKRLLGPDGEISC